MKKRQGEIITGKFKEWIGDKIIILNAKYNDGALCEFNEEIVLKKRNIKYLALLMILCENIKEISCVVLLLFYYKKWDK